MKPHEPQEQEALMNETGLKVEKKWNIWTLYWQRWIACYFKIIM